MDVNFLFAVEVMFDVVCCVVLRPKRMVAAPVIAAAPIGAAILED